MRRRKRAHAGIRADMAATQRVRGLLARLLAAWRHKLAQLHHATHRQQLIMFDSVDLAEIPRDAHAVAGYVGGRWPTFQHVRARWPDAQHLSIAISASETAKCLDIENGDATPDHAAAWVRLMQNRHFRRPCIYASRSTMPTIVTRLKDAGIRRDEVRLWVADWTDHAHIPHGYDACQWTDKARGRNLDQSALRSDFWT